MSLRAKLVLALVLLTTAATLTIGVWSYVGTADRLESEIDRSLADGLGQISDRAPDRRDHPGVEPEGLGPGGSDQVVYQLLDGRGAPLSAFVTVSLPVDDTDRAIAASSLPPDDAPRATRDVSVDGEPYRLLTTALGNGRGAVQVARSLAETNRVLDSLRNLILVAAAVVITGAAFAGWLIARQVTRRLVRLTGAAEEVAATGRLDVTVPVGGADEAGRLGTAFNEMLTALHQSRDAQQRLVQDAGHELRTPLTSLRTNVSVLRRHDQLPVETRGRVLDDLDAETRELTTLVDELVELATDARTDEAVEDVALGPLVDRVAARARRRTGRQIEVHGDDSHLLGRPQALERAVSNLLDNATKFDPEGRAPVEATVQAGRVEVCDRGPGIDPTDLPHVFDRFYRAVAARSRPGSGLGLAIVADVAESHGGRVFARAREGGGTCVGFEVPVSSS